MSSFFDSEIIQDELKEINEIQEFLYSTVFTFGSLSSEEKIDHIDKMTELLDKQKVMYILGCRYLTTPRQSNEGTTQEVYCTYGFSC